MIKPTPSQAYSAAFGSVLLWGTSFAVTKFVMPEPLDVITFTALQTLIGTISIFIIFLLKGEISAWFKTFRRNFGTFLGLGICCYSGAYLLQFWGLSLSSAINQSIISNTQTFWVILLNILVFKHRTSRIFIFGTILAFVGITIVVIPFDQGMNLSWNTIGGDVLSLISFMLWGAYTAFSQPISMKENVFHILGGIFICADFLLIPFLFLPSAYSIITSLTLYQWGVMAYLGIGCAALVFLLWAIALANPDVPSEKISLISMLLPIVGIITSMLLLQESITPIMIAGCFIVLCGMFFANWEEFSRFFHRH